MLIYYSRRALVFIKLQYNSLVSCSLAGPNTGHEWSKEGHRNFALLHRSVPQTALLRAADAAQAFVQRANAALPVPAHTARDRTLDETPIDGRTGHVVMADPHAPPPIPPSQPTTSLPQKPLLKRSTTAAAAAAAAARADDASGYQRRRLISETALPSHSSYHMHNFYQYPTSSSMRIQELYHQHINTPQPSQPAGVAGITAMPTSAHPTAPVIAMPFANNGPPILSPTSLSAYQSQPTAVRPLKPGTGTGSHPSKRAPKAAANSQSKPSRSAKTPRTPGSAVPRAGPRTAKSAPHAARQRPPSQPPMSPTAAAAAAASQQHHSGDPVSSYGSTLKSRKLTYPQDKAGLAETFTSSGSVTTFVWQPQTAAADQQQPQHFTLSSGETHQMLQSYAPLRLSPQPQQQLLTQNSPVQVVFTSSTVAMLPTDGAGADDMHSAGRGPMPSSFITESTPITWVTDDAAAAEVAVLAAGGDPQSQLVVQSDVPPPLPIGAATSAPPPTQSMLPHQLFALQSHQQQQQQQSPMAAPGATAPPPAPRPKLLGHTARKPTSMPATGPHAAKPAKNSRKKHPIDVMSTVYAPAMPSLPLPAISPVKQTPPHRILSAMPMSAAATPQTQNKTSATIMHPPIPAHLQQLLDTSLQIHSITNKPTAASSAAATKAPTPIKLMPNAGMQIVHKLLSPPPQPRAAFTVPTSASNSSTTTKPKIHITHQEILVAPQSGGKQATSAMLSAGIATNIIVGSGQLKPMQSKGNVKLVQSANGSLMLRDCGGGGSGSGAVSMSATTTTATSTLPRVCATALPTASSGTVTSSAPISSNVAAAIGTGTAVAKPQQFPKIQLVKARGGVASKMVLMQKLPSGTFNATAASQAPAPHVSTVNTNATVTLNKDLLSTLKLVPMKQPLQSTVQSAPAAAGKLVLVSAAGGGPTAMAPTAVPLARTMFVPFGATPTPATKSPQKITEDTPVDFVVSAEPSAVPAPGQTKIVLDTIVPLGKLASHGGAATKSSIAASSVAGLKHKLTPMAASAATATTSTTASAASSGAAAAASFGGHTTSPLKRIRIDAKKMVKMVRPVHATTTLAATGAVAKPAYVTTSVMRTVPVSVSMPVSAPLLVASTDWERELDVEAERRHERTPPTGKLTTAAAAATGIKVVSGRTEAMADVSDAESGGDGDAATSDEAIFVGEYMASEDDIIQYEGGEYMWHYVANRCQDRNSLSLFDNL